MIKIFKINILLLLLISIGCTKDITNVNEYTSVDLNSMFSSSKQSSATIQNVSTFKDILRFKTLEDFELARKTLLEMQFSEISSFNAKYIDESKEDFEYLDKIAEEIGFSEENIYEQFNSALNFNSLRIKINKEEAEFLNNENPNWEENPISHFLGTPDFFTLINPFNEYMIGDMIYKTFEDGLTLIVNDKDYDAILELRENREDYVNIPSVSVYNDDNISEKYSSTNKTNGNGCRMNRGKVNYQQYIKYGSLYKVYKKAGIADIGLVDWTYTTMTHYKKQGLKWKKSAAPIQSEVNTTVRRFYSCRFNENLSSSASYTLKSLYTNSQGNGPHVMMAIRRNGCSATYKANYVNLSPIYVSW